MENLQSTKKKSIRGTTSFPVSENQGKRNQPIMENPKSSKFDPLGSWTGNPANRQEVPVQDADDL